MQVINMDTLQRLIDHKVIARNHILDVHGASGIGKTEGIEQAAERHSATLITICVSQWESVDFRGIPDIQLGSTVWNMPATLPFKGNPRFNEDDGIIIVFFDEVNQGDPSVLSVLYQLLQSRRAGEHILMDNVRIICAQNRGMDKGLGVKMPMPLNNRMTHVELLADVKPWSVWANRKGLPATLIGFLNFRSELFHTFDPNDPHPDFATPRSWVRAAEDFADKTLPDDVRQAAISGDVGEGPMTELFAFERIMDSIVPIEQIIADPTGVPVSDELDVQWAMSVHVAGHMSKTNADQLSKFLNRLDTECGSPEMVALAWTMAIQRDEDVTDTNAFLYDYAPKYRGLYQI